jgi:regulatory protein
MRLSPQRKPRPPLNREKLNELALAYVGRFATTRAKLRSYLQRKVRERGWDGRTAADIDGLAERFAAQRYVDDAAYARSKSRSLTGRGYGLRRVEQSLRTAGVDEADGIAARDLARTDSVESALRFAERRHLGPFAKQVGDRKSRERALAAMIRAGHGFGLARAILDLPPGTEIDVANLSEINDLTQN